MHPMLNIAVKAARRAGQIINRASLDLDLIQISKKQHNDFVTEVDKASEAAVIDILKTAYPDHAILAEESGRRDLAWRMGVRRRGQIDDGVIRQPWHLTRIGSVRILAEGEAAVEDDVVSRIQRIRINRH